MIGVEAILMFFLELTLVMVTLCLLLRLRNSVGTSSFTILIGALIILSNDNIPAQVLESGVILDANISSQLIEGIFFVKAPLHDGAMIINNYKIQAAGCFLPLTQNVNIPKELGTRHRAGIGITETTNVIALIVSEETGIITIAQRGKISRYADYDLLKKTLSDYYWKDLSADWRKRI